MEPVVVEARSLDEYSECVEPAALDGLRRLAKPLRGLRVLHVNATPVGGGVAEILGSLIPLLRDLGIDADWQTIVGEPAFFEVTKTIHNALQGDNAALTDEQHAIYHACQQRNSLRIRDDYDVIVVHDPQPMGLPIWTNNGRARWLWRLHVDSSQPDEAVWAFLRPSLDGYDRAIFSLERFIPTGVRPERARVIAPAIDPLAPKNRPIPIAAAMGRLRRIGVDPTRPLIAQIARLDPWKDPWGVIDSFRLMRERAPGLQLALLGVIAARDDPEAYAIHDSVRDYAGGDPDIHIFVDPNVIGPLEVASVQTVAQVVFQKSLKEGFGLSVTEALWKATPVIGGRAGGIPLQLDDRVGGFLVDSVEEAAERATWLIENPPEARVIAARGRERVRERFLITRLLADELRLYGEVAGASPAVS